MANEITDEIIETGAKAIAKYFKDKDWQQYKAAARSAITAVAPRLRAQGIQYAIQELDDVEDGTSYPPRLWARRRAVLAKAAELEQGK